MVVDGSGRQWAVKGAPYPRRPPILLRQSRLWTVMPLIISPTRAVEAFGVRCTDSTAKANFATNGVRGLRLLDYLQPCTVPQGHLGSLRGTAYQDSFDHALRVKKASGVPACLRVPSLTGGARYEGFVINSAETRGNATVCHLTRLSHHTNIEYQ